MNSDHQIADESKELRLLLGERRTNGSTIRKTSPRPAKLRSSLSARSMRQPLRQPRNLACFSYGTTARLTFTVVVLLLIGSDLVVAGDDAKKEAPEKGAKQSKEAPFPEPSNSPTPLPAKFPTYLTTLGEIEDWHFPTRSPSILVVNSRTTPTHSPRLTTIEANNGGSDLSGVDNDSFAPSLAPTHTFSPSAFPSATTSDPTNTAVPTSELSTLSPSASLGPSTSFTPTIEASQENRPTSLQLPDVAINLTFSTDSKLTFTTEDVQNVTGVYLQEELEKQYGGSKKYEFSQLWMNLDDFSTPARRRLSEKDEIHRFYFLSGFALFEGDAWPSIQEFTDLMFEKLSAENLIVLFQATEGKNGLSSVLRVSVGPGVRPVGSETDGEGEANRSTGENPPRDDDGNVLPLSVARVVLIVAGVVVLISVGICVEVGRRHITGDPIPGLGMTLSSGGYFFDARSGVGRKKGFSALDDESDLAGSPRSPGRGPGGHGRPHASIPDSNSSLAGLSIEESAQSSYSIDDGWVTSPRYEEHEVIYNGPRFGRVVSLPSNGVRPESADEESSSYLPRR